MYNENHTASTLLQNGRKCKFYCRFLYITYSPATPIVPIDIILTSKDNQGKRDEGKTYYCYHNKISIISVLRAYPDT